MPPKYIDVQQGTPAWLKCRIGRITASKLADVMKYNQPSAEVAKQAGFKLVREAVAAGIKGEESQKRIDYRMDLVAERLTGMAEENYVSPDMDWGSANEDEARVSYEMAFDVMVDRVGFVVHGDMDFTGASPDALVGQDGVLEIKCPKTTTHIAWKVAGVVPEEYKPQMLWEMECTERKFSDFVSYDPRIEDPALRIFCVRYDYDPILAESYRAEVQQFNADIEAYISRLQKGRAA